MDAAGWRVALDGGPAEGSDTPPGSPARVPIPAAEPEAPVRQDWTGHYIVSLGLILLAAVVVFVVVLFYRGGAGYSASLLILGWTGLGFALLLLGAIAAMIAARRYDRSLRRRSIIGGLLLIAGVCGLLTMRVLSQSWLDPPTSLPAKGVQFSGFTDLSYRLLVVAGLELGLGATMACGVYAVALGRDPEFGLVHPSWLLIAAIIALVVVYLGQAALFASIAPSLDLSVQQGNTKTVAIELVDFSRQAAALSILLVAYYGLLATLTMKAVTKD